MFSQEMLENSVITWNFFIGKRIGGYRKPDNPQLSVKTYSWT